MIKVDGVNCPPSDVVNILTTLINVRMMMMMANCLPLEWWFILWNQDHDISGTTPSLNVIHCPVFMIISMLFYFIYFFFYL